jgi:type I restriction enzyme S subunit
VRAGTFAKLGAVCRVINGRAYKKDELLSKGETRVIRVGNFFTSDKWYYSNLKLDVDKYCDDGDLLYAWSASFGPRIWSGGRAIFHYHIWKMEPDASIIHDRWLYYWLQWDTEKIKAAHGVGATMLHVTKGAMEARDLFIPPLDEQKRIVATLDEAFEGIAKATANAEKNSGSARELLGAALRQELNVASESWTECSIGDQITLQRGVDITKSEQRAGKVPVVSSGGVKSFHNTAVARAPGVVIGRKGSLGTAYFVEEDYWPHDTTLWVRDFKGNCEKFVFYVLQSLDLKSLDSGSANPALNRNNVHPIRVVWPPRVAQDRIVERLNRIGASCERLTEIYAEKKLELSDLSSTLLHKAFTGQLTSADTIAA